MQIVTTVAGIRSQPPRRPRVLVPTMGALHKGHLQLIQTAREHAGSSGEVFVSIFVNPLQFEPGADYERYPRPEQADEEFCREAGVSILFRPALADMYADDRSVFVEEVSIARTLEGVARPGHFRGVCTVVAKLFNIVMPEIVVFGEKDYQQLAVIRRMVRDLGFDLSIVPVPTVREDNGLACSSRNQYLNAEERAQASVLYNALRQASASARAGEKSARAIIDSARDTITKAPLARIDYVELVDPENFQSVDTLRPNSLLALAVFFGKTRLIDNTRLP